MTKYQDSISKEDLYVYLNYLLSGDVESERQAKEVNRIARRTVTLSDCAAVVKVAMQAHSDVIKEMADRIHVQALVIQELGGTEEMFRKAKREYEERIANQVAKIKEAIEEAQAEQSEESTGVDHKLTLVDTVETSEN